MTELEAIALFVRLRDQQIAKGHTFEEACKLVNQAIKDALKEVQPKG
jgi:hypothetical protein